MNKSKIKKKRKCAGTSNFYFALKSQDDIYYQMASVFKAVTQDDEEAAKKIFSRCLTTRQSEMFLENSL